MRVRVASGPARGQVSVATGERFTIGRGTGCDIVIADDTKVSNLHAYLKVVNRQGAIIHDCGSTNGTFVDGTRLTVPQMLRGGEEVRVGDTLLVVSSSDERTGADDPPAPAPGVEATMRRPPVLEARPVGPAPMGRSTLQRLTLARSVRTASVLSVVALVAVIAVIGLFVSGVLPRGGTSSPPAAATPAQVVDAVRPSTVAVESRRDAGPVNGGTGWVLDAAQGLVMTNNHVVNGGTSFRVGVGDQQRDAQLVAASPCDDLALLRVSDSAGMKTMPLGVQRDLKLGDPVLAVGFPSTGSGRHDLTATTGVVSVVQTSLGGNGPEPDLPNVIQTDAAINPGSSGGPLVSSRRVLVGVNTATIVSTGGRLLQNTNIAIGVDRVKEVAAELRQGRSIGATGLGLDVLTPQSDLAALGLPNRPGLVISGAAPGTTAAAAGLGREPALLVAVDGRPIDGTLTSYCASVRTIRSGDTGHLSIIRSGTSEPVDVTVRFA
jgi:S1-C subfamily serine protease